MSSCSIMIIALVDRWSLRLYANDR